MRYRNAGTLIAVALVAAVVGGTFTLSVGRLSGQTNRPERPERIEGRPNFSGIWQANNEAHWDLEAHAARPAMITQPGVYPYEYARLPAAPVVALGVVAAVPGSLGVVQGDGRIPYTPRRWPGSGRTPRTGSTGIRKSAATCRAFPRAMYMPYPFEITQSTNKIHMAFTYSSTARTIHMDEVEPRPTSPGWATRSVAGRADALVVEVDNFHDNGWFDRAGNHHSGAMRLEERFTLVTPNVIDYEVTIEDPNTFTRPWRIAMPLYRRMETNMQLLEFRCQEFAEEFMYGHLRKEPLVTRWESATMEIEVTRKIPEGDAFYEWYSR